MIDRAGGGGSSGSPLSFSFYTLNLIMRREKYKEASINENMKYKRYLSLITQSETNKWYFINMSTGTIIYDTCTSNHVDMRERERDQTQGG